MDDAVRRALLDDATAGLPHVPLHRPLPNPTKTSLPTECVVIDIAPALRCGAFILRPSLSNCRTAILRKHHAVRAGSTFKKFAIYRLGMPGAGAGAIRQVHSRI
jgi:hypothetical protein